MRVLLVHNFYQIPGGEDSVVQDELSVLKNNGVDVKLFSVTNDDIRGMSGKIATAVQAVYSPRARHQLAKQLAEFVPDVVHVHNFFPLLSPSIFDACRDAGVPSVLTLHNFRILSPAALLHPDEITRKHRLRDSCWWSVPKGIYRNSVVGTLAVAAMIEFHKRAGTWSRKVDRFIALTDAAKQMFAQAGLPAERIVVKPNCVARPPASHDTPRHGGLFVGRLDEQKGIELILRAWKEIDYPLRIIGDGPLSELVQRSVNNRIVYLGRLPRHAVQQEMQAAKFLIFPSVGFEMFPMTIVEAFANRLPVICSELPILRELVEPGINGLVFAPGDSNAIVARVRWALSNPSALDELGRHAHSIYEDRYTPEANFNGLIRIYRSLLQNRHTSGARQFSKQEVCA
ncbi:MAG TPA: glycosyltransferase family 4 protein [Pseudolabrys sp.]|nr:glycosyltransferase family 4 protein [Pseudolabrys sp.]